MGTTHRVKSNRIWSYSGPHFPEWSAFSRIRTEKGEILRISPYSFQIRVNADRNISEYEHFLLSDYFTILALKIF